MKQKVLDLSADSQISQLEDIFSVTSILCSVPSKKRLGSSLIGPGSGPDDPDVCSTVLSCRTPLEMIIAIVMSPSPDTYQAQFNFFVKLPLHSPPSSFSGILYPHPYLGKVLSLPVPHLFSSSSQQSFSGVNSPCLLSVFFIWYLGGQQSNLQL